MKNDTFSAAFYQRYTELLRTNFSEDAASAAIGKWVNRTKAAVINIYARFGLVTNYDTSEKLLRHFYEKRVAWALHQLKLLRGIPDDWDDADIPDIDPLSCGLCMTYAYDAVGGIGTLELADDGTAKISAE